MKKKIIIALLVILALWVGASVISRSAFRVVPEIRRPESPAHTRTKVGLMSSFAPKYPVYPYSILPGGIHDAAALQMAYKGGFLPADFNLKNARLIRVSKAFCTYVTFRDKDGQIVWSKHKICIRAGELAITDGKYTLLGRCGNRIAMSLPRDAPVQTAPVDLDIPVPEVSTEPGLASSLYPEPDTWLAPIGPADVSTGGIFPLPSVPPVFFCCAATVAAPVSVPDGSRWTVTLLAGLILAGAILAKARS
ncbi:MAG: hypothetical protein WB711_15225 [Terriglobales bacterium]